MILLQASQQDPSAAVLPLVFFLLVRIIAPIICYQKAKELNRDAVGFAIFGFLLPIIAIIWVYCSKPRVKVVNPVVSPVNNEL